MHYIPISQTASKARDNVFPNAPIYPFKLKGSRNKANLYLFALDRNPDGRRNLGKFHLEEVHYVSKTNGLLTKLQYVELNADKRIKIAYFIPVGFESDPIFVE